MTFEINWYTKFGISWAYEDDRLVVSTVFEDKTIARFIADQVDVWNNMFTRLSIIEHDDDIFSLCCYQDPLISKRDINIGLYRAGMRHSGYEQAKPMIEERAPLVQIAYAADIRDMRTYEQISRLIPIRKCRIITARDLKRQEYYYERVASQQT